MATQYEILLQQQLQQPHTLDEYSSGLVLLAQRQAHQRFLEEQALAANRFAAQQQAAHLAGQKEILTATQKGQAEIESAKEKAAFERTQEMVKGMEERARIQAEAVEKSRIAAQREDEKQRLIREFGELFIKRKPGESDDDYIARAQDEAVKIRAGHLAKADQNAQAYIDQINTIAAKGAASHPQRMSDFAWEGVVAMADDPKMQQQLRGQTTPAQRDAALAKLGSGKEARAMRDFYQIQLDKARTAVPVLEPTQEVEIKRLGIRANSAATAFDELMKNPKYAPAVPEYNRIIGEEDFPGEIGPPRKGAGGGASSLDFSKAVTSGASKPAGWRA